MPNITDQRADLILEIEKGLKDKLDFNVEFYNRMMELKEKGLNLWFSDEEESFYRNLYKR